MTDPTSSPVPGEDERLAEAEWSARDALEWAVRHQRRYVELSPGVMRVLLAELGRLRAELALANSALVLCRWLITLDDPEDVQGREDRRTVTLTQICNKARAALGWVGEYPRPASAPAELERLRAQRDAVLAALDRWRSGAHDLAGSHAALARISEALGVATDAR